MRTPKTYLLIGVLVAYVLTPLVVPDPYFMRIASYIAVNVIVVLGLAMLFGYSGQISMGHAAFVGIGAYTVAFLTVKAGLPWALASLAAVALSGALGWLLAWPCLRLKGHYLAMATLAFGLIALVAFNELRTITGGPDGIGGIPVPSIGPLTFTTQASWFYLSWGLVGLCAIVAWRFTSGLRGLRVKAVRGSEQGAASVGIDVARTKVQTFALSAAFAGLAGALYASIVGFISPSLFAVDYSVRYLATTVLGGPYSLIGPTVSTIALTGLQYIEAFFPGMPRAVVGVFQSFESDIFGIAIIVVVLFAPRGIRGVLSRRARGGESK